MGGMPTARSGHVVFSIACPRKTRWAWHTRHPTARRRSEFAAIPRARFFISVPSSSLGAHTPKLRFGWRATADEDRSRASGICVPKRSLGTRKGRDFCHDHEGAIFLRPRCTDRETDGEPSVWEGVGPLRCSGVSWAVRSCWPSETDGSLIVAPRHARLQLSGRRWSINDAARFPNRRLAVGPNSPHHEGAIFAAITRARFFCGRAARSRNRRQVVGLGKGGPLPRTGILRACEVDAYSTRRGRPIARTLHAGAGSERPRGDGPLAARVTLLARVDWRGRPRACFSRT